MTLRTQEVREAGEDRRLRQREQHGIGREGTGRCQRLDVARLKERGRPDASAVLCCYLLSYAAAVHADRY